MTRMKLKGLRAGRAAAFALCLALCAAAAVVPSHAAVTASGVFDNGVSWTLDSGGTLTISGSGPIPFMGMAAMNQPPSWRDARRLVIENGVTDIGYMAFLSLEKLEEVSLPDTATARSGTARV